MMTPEFTKEALRAKNLPLGRFLSDEKSEVADKWRQCLGLCSSFWPVSRSVDEWLVFGQRRGMPIFCFALKAGFYRAEKGYWINAGPGCEEVS